MLNVDEINRLNQENEAYKQSEQEAQEIIAELKAYKDVNEDFKTAWEELKAENVKLKSCLQEIKTIAERCNLCEECSGLDDCERECGDAVEPCSTYQMKIIVSKITKAEEE